MKLFKTSGPDGEEFHFEAEDSFELGVINFLSRIKTITYNGVSLSPRRLNLNEIVFCPAKPAELSLSPLPERLEV